MKNKKLFSGMLVLILVIIVSASCGPGQLFGPTLTPTPRPTRTARTIPPATISGTALHNNTPLVNVAIKLARDIDGKDVITETQTDAKGHFVFENVTPVPGDFYLIGALRKEGMLCTKAQVVEVYRGQQVVSDMIFDCL